MCVSRVITFAAAVAAASAFIPQSVKSRATTATYCSRRGALSSST